jgi:hypothetical protein
MTPERFWNKVHKTLDQRKDPLLDPDLQAYLLEHPEALEEVADLRYGLQLLEKVPALPARKPWKLLLGMGAAAACLAALLFWISGDPPLAKDPGPSSVILDFRLSITSKGPGEESEHLYTSEGWISRWTSYVEPSGKEKISVACVERERHGRY